MNQVQVTSSFSKWKPGTYGVSEEPFKRETKDETHIEVADKRGLAQMQTNVKLSSILKNVSLE